MASAEQPMSAETSLLQQNTQQQDLVPYSIVKRYPKRLLLALITVISLVVAITVAILVVVPYQHTGSRKRDLYSRSYTLGDTSLTTVDTEFCSQASMNLEYDSLSNDEVKLEAFPNYEKPSLTSESILQVKDPDILMTSGNSQHILTAHLHPGSYTVWSQTISPDWDTGGHCGDDTTIGYVLIFQGESNYKQQMVYKNVSFYVNMCYSEPCTLPFNYDIESDYYHVIASIPGSCEYHIDADITVHQKQYEIPNGGHGCITNSSSTSCKVSTKPGPNLAVEVTGLGSADWKRTVHVSLHCVPSDGLYAAVGLSIVIGIILLVCFCIGLYTVLKKGKSMRSCDTEPNAHRSATIRTMDNYSASLLKSSPSTTRAPDDGDNRRVMDNDALMPPLGYSAAN